MSDLPQSGEASQSFGSLSLKWLNTHAAMILIVAAMLAVAGARFRLIGRFGSDVPNGDQWYGEITRTYTPWLQGNFGFSFLFGLHNEHRIVATRLLDILLLTVNGQWDPRMQITVNTLILLSALAVLLCHLARHLPPLALALIAMMSTIFFGSSDTWENALCGFQSQFYFLLLFSLIHVLQTTSARPFSMGWWLGHIFGLCNLFTMAAGPLSACAVLGWLIWRRFCVKKRVAGDMLTAFWNLALLAGGYLLLPYSPTVGHIGPTTPIEWSQALLHILSWPVLKWQFGVVVWAPVFLFLSREVIQPSTQAERGWLVGLVLLAALFILATAVARGGTASRYSELFSLGILTNLLCIVTQLSHGWRRILTTVLGAFWLMFMLSDVA